MRVRTLDTHEQKSPQYLIVGLGLGRENIKTLKVGDYEDTNDDAGFKTELKHEDFNLKSKDTLEQFEKELGQMMVYHTNHPKVFMHAIWNKKNIWDKEVNFAYIEKFGEYRSQIAVFLSMCQDYGVKGHVVDNNEAVIGLLKRLKSWKPTTVPHIIRSHEEPTTKGKMLRQIDGVSSEKAINGSQTMFYEELVDVLGRKKDGTPYKIVDDVMKELDDFVRWYQLIKCSFLSPSETGEEP